jgi:hypothetical protein
VFEAYTYIGAADPDAGLGAVGDTYLNETAGTSWVKGAGGWVQAVTTPESSVSNLVADLAARTKKADVVVNVRDFGAVPGQNIDAALLAAVAAAAAERAVATDVVEVLVPRGRYLITNPTIATPWVRLRGQGATLLKNANGPALTINAQGVELIHLHIDGNAANFTGPTITCQSCADLKVRFNRILNGRLTSPLILFSTANQARREIAFNHLEIDGQPQTLGVFDTSIDGGAGAPDMLVIGNWTRGCPIDARGANNLFLAVNVCSRILYDATSNKVMALGNRIATSGTDLTILGSNHTFRANEVNATPGDIVLGVGATNCEIDQSHTTGGGGAAGRVLDKSGTVTNSVEGRALVPGARVSHGVDQDTTSAVFLWLAFNTERYDRGSCHDTAVTNGRLYFPEPGRYFVWGGVAFTSNATGTRILRIRKNGNDDLAYQQVGAAPTAATRLSVSTEDEFAGPSALTGDTTNGSPNVTNVAVTAGSRAPTVGQAISGAGIPNGARIGSIAGSTYGLVDDNGAAVNATATAAGVALTSKDYVELSAYQDSGAAVGAVKVVSGASYSPVFGIGYRAARANA